MSKELAVASFQSKGWLEQELLEGRLKIELPPGSNVIPLERQIQLIDLAGRQSLVRISDGTYAPYVLVMEVMDIPLGSRKERIGEHDRKHLAKLLEGRVERFNEGIKRSNGRLASGDDFVELVEGETVDVDVNYFHPHERLLFGFLDMPIDSLGIGEAGDFVGAGMYLHADGSTQMLDLHMGVDSLEKYEDVMSTAKDILRTIKSGDVIDLSAREERLPALHGDEKELLASVPEDWLIKHERTLLGDVFTLHSRRTSESKGNPLHQEAYMMIGEDLELLSNTVDDSVFDLKKRQADLFGSSCEWVEIWSPDFTEAPVLIEANIRAPWMKYMLEVHVVIKTEDPQWLEQALEVFSSFEVVDKE